MIVTSIGQLREALAYLETEYARNPDAAQVHLRGSSEDFDLEVKLLESGAGQTVLSMIVQQDDDPGSNGRAVNVERSVEAITVDELELRGDSDSLWDVVRYEVRVGRLHYDEESRTYAAETLGRVMLAATSRRSDALRALCSELNA